MSKSNNSKRIFKTGLGAIVGAGALLLVGTALAQGPVAEDAAPEAVELAEASPEQGQSEAHRKNVGHQTNLTVADKATLRQARISLREQVAVMRAEDAPRESIRQLRREAHQSMMETLSPGRSAVVRERIESRLHGIERARSHGASPMGTPAQGRGRGMR